MLKINIKKFFYYLIALLVSFPLYITYVDGSLRFDNSAATPLENTSIQVGFFIIFIYLIVYFPRKVTQSYYYLLIYFIIFYILKLLFGFDFYVQQIIVSIQILVVASFVETDFFKKFQDELKIFPIIIFLVVISDFIYDAWQGNVTIKVIPEIPQFLNTKIHLYHYYDYWPGAVTIAALYLINKTIALKINVMRLNINLILAILLLMWVIFFFTF